MFRLSPPPREITRVDIPADPERLQRIQEQVREARDRMGTRWVLHPDNALRRRASEDDRCE